jgi:hypothetical protein
MKLIRLSFRTRAALLPPMTNHPNELRLPSPASIHRFLFLDPVLSSVPVGRIDYSVCQRTRGGES